MARKTRCTPDLIEAISDRVCNGSFPYVAAQSCGIPQSTFYGWMKLGEEGTKPYSDLSDKVKTAQAEARKDAESRVFLQRPLEWLRLGPGRSTPEEPGWTDVADNSVTVNLNGPVAANLTNDQCYLQVDQDTVHKSFLEMRIAGISVDAILDEELSKLIDVGIVEEDISPQQELVPVK